MSMSGLSPEDQQVVGWLSITHSNGGHTYWAFGVEAEFTEASAIARKAADERRIARALAYTGTSRGIVRDSGGMNDAYEFENCLRERGEYPA